MNFKVKVMLSGTAHNIEGPLFRRVYCGGQGLEDFLVLSLTLRRGLLHGPMVYCFLLHSLDWPVVVSAMLTVVLSGVVVNLYLPERSSPGRSVAQ